MTMGVSQGTTADTRVQSVQPMRIYAVVLGVGVMCSLAIVITYELTRPVIATNRVSQRREAILEVIPEAESIVAFAFDRDQDLFRSVSQSSDEYELVFVGFDSSGGLVGVAMPAQAMGYQDTIRLLYGYEPTTQTVIGIRVLESRETPGLGDRIESDPDYLSNFDSLDVQLGEDGKTLAHEIAFVKQGKKTEPWQVDGITGATISSKAVAEMLRDSTNVWIPRIRASLSQFHPPSVGGTSP